MRSTPTDSTGTTGLADDQTLPARSGIPPWLPIAVVACVPLAILRIKLGGVRDPDAFWHIRAGLHVWATHQISGPDPFGTFTARTWVQHEWLSEVVMGRFYAAFGLAGVAWLYAVSDVILFFALYRLSRVWSGPLVAGLVGAIAWLGTSASLVQRPQVVSFVLLAVTLRAWSARAERAAPPWWLIPVTWVWACSHGLWLTGPLTGLAVVVGLLIDRSVTLREASRLALVPIVSVLAAALTPIGPRLLLTPFTVNSYAGLVTEWAPPDIHQPFVAATLALLVATAVGWFMTAGSITWGRILIWLMAFGWALLYSRTVALGAVLVAPLAAEQLQRLLRRPAEAQGAIERLTVGGALAAAMLVAGVMAPSQAIRAVDMPTALDGSLSALPSGAVVLDDDSVGGWLLLEHPDLRPVIDTRTEIYDPSYVASFINARAARPGWTDFVSMTRPTVALLLRDAPLVDTLTASSGWRVVGSDERFVLLEPPAT